MTQTAAATPRPASFGMWNGPAFVIMYGDKGIGKSIDQFLADPLAWTLGKPGCLKGARWFCGDAVFAAGESLVVEVNYVEDVVAVLQQIADGRRERRNIRIDDFSVLVTSTLVRLKGHYGDVGNGVRKTYDHLRSLNEVIKTYATALGVHVFASAHVMPGHTTDNRGFVKGGPDVGGPRGVEDLLAVAHVVYKVEPDNTRWPWPAAVRCDNPSAMWEFKDRHNIIFGTGPMNLREILHAADYFLPRYPGMEWQDEWAEQVADQISAGAPASKVFTEATQALEANGIPRGVAYWTARDGVCRHELRSRQDPLSRALAVMSGSGVAGGPPVPAPLGQASAAPVPPK